MNKKSETKCYNSWSCIVSCLIIIFIVFAIAYDLIITKPQMRKDIKEIRENVQQLNEKIDNQQQMLKYTDIVDSLNTADTVNLENSEIL